MGDRLEHPKMSEQMEAAVQCTLAQGNGGAVVEALGEQTLTALGLRHQCPALSSSGTSGTGTMCVNWRRCRCPDVSDQDSSMPRWMVRRAWDDRRLLRWCVRSWFGSSRSRLRDRLLQHRSLSMGRQQWKPGIWTRV